MLGGTFFSQYYGPASMSGNTEITSVRANRGTYSNVIKVQWDVRQVGTDPTRFEVFRRLLGSENPEDYQSVHVTSGTESSYFFADEAVQPGQFYQYRVVAQNNCVDKFTNETNFIQADWGEADGFCNTRGTITIHPNGSQKGVKHIVLDGQPIEGSVIPYAPGKHTVEVTM